MNNLFYLLISAMLAFGMTGAFDGQGTITGPDGREYTYSYNINIVEVPATGTSPEGEAPAAVSPASEAPVTGYTLNISQPGTYSIPVQWEYFYCVNSTPELAGANSFTYKEADPLGSGPMWIGYAAPTDKKDTFTVTADILQKMTKEAQGVALFCQFNP